ncbi:MAG: hypothetical protein QG667_382 [Pseudomonadota bacterium]|nr:hypothetical protein [Pseudomonadota bacterium]
MSENEKPSDPELEKEQREIRQRLIVRVAIAVGLIGAAAISLPLIDKFKSSAPEVAINPPPTSDEKPRASLAHRRPNRKIPPSPKQVRPTSRLRPTAAKMGAHKQKPSPRRLLPQSRQQRRCRHQGMTRKRLRPNRQPPLPARPRRRHR